MTTEIRIHTSCFLLHAPCKYIGRYTYIHRSINHGSWVPHLPWLVVVLLDLTVKCELLIDAHRGQKDIDHVIGEEVGVILKAIGSNVVLPNHYRDRDRQGVCVCQEENSSMVYSCLTIKPEAGFLVPVLDALDPMIYIVGRYPARLNRS